MKQFGRKALLLGSGELGKEVAIELMRFGVYVVAADRYEGAPAQQIANEARVLDMTDPDQLRFLIEEVKPDLVVPEIEAIATNVLVDVEKSGMTGDCGKPIQIVPSAKAVHLTMDREGIRKLAAEDLKINTSPYKFADSLEDVRRAVEKLGFPVVIKPVQSSSGKGQSVVKYEKDLEDAWNFAQEGARGGHEGEIKRVIVEGFVDFDYEITLLTLRYRRPDKSNGVIFLEPIGHHQVDGDYRESWQKASISDKALAEAQQIADKVTSALVSEVETGWGIFGVELFITHNRTGEEKVIFSEVSPRPHDTGMVTMISQDRSEFSLHAMAMLGIPIIQPTFLGPSASAAVIARGNGVPVVTGVADALLNSHKLDIKTSVRIFAKPKVEGERRVAVALTRYNPAIINLDKYGKPDFTDTELAVDIAKQVANNLTVELR
ncbi:MAG: formate-dependent phosphoribosylglycinamide formyltransferase [Candidatus Ancillula sp.]|nr:formate-dependent phosphoribosylglycinamide formyltransferase [Candidatus Ancillula sp.]